MKINEECDCLKGKNCCECGEILGKDELKPGVNPYAEDICDDHSEHLLCDECGYTSAMDS
ncbi:hypothetical protein LCGC14_1036100 [marine sediment metagenome]|uniref:Uncharacterized protein n=1 Tax=marine sediment metagenome TaxID=412755 RepID=A0A0F9QZ96_9ZZZZ